MKDFYENKIIDGIQVQREAVELFNQSFQFILVGYKNKEDSVEKIYQYLHSFTNYTDFSNFKNYIEAKKKEQEAN